MSTSPHSPTLQFYNPTRSHNSDNGISKFASLKSCFISSVSCSGQCFMEGCGDFSPKVNPARLWLYANLCSSVEEGEKLQCNTEEWLLYYSKIEGQKIPFVIIYGAKGRKISSQCDGFYSTRAGLDVYLEKTYFCSSAGEWPLFSLGLC